MIKVLAYGMPSADGVPADDLFPLLQGVSLKLLYINAHTVAVFLRRNAEDARAFELLFTNSWYIDLPTQLGSVNVRPGSEEDVEVVRRQVPASCSVTENRIIGFDSDQGRFRIMAYRLSVYEVDTLEDCSHAQTDARMNKVVRDCQST